MSKKSIALLLTVFLAFLLPMAASAECVHTCGHITKIHSYEAANNGTAGAVIGAVAGGAYAGKKVADNTSRTRYKITVKMNDGHFEHLDQGSAKNLHEGDYVKVKNGKASRL